MMTVREPVFASILQRSGEMMEAQAVIFEKPGQLASGRVELSDPDSNDVVVETLWSGISTGTERLLWEGRMPEFPGMGYPLVPGYETVGEIVDCSSASGRRTGERVFVPGCAAYKSVRGLFGGTCSTLIVDSAKAVPVDKTLGSDATLYALAATAHHIVSGHSLPDLIVGCGVLGRLLARITVALGGKPPVIWETNPLRRSGFEDFKVIDPKEDVESTYNTIVDVTGDSGIVDTLVGHLEPHGEIVLGGFYSERIGFAFPSAFIKEAKLRVAAEWKPDDMASVGRLCWDGRLNLDGLVTHELPLEAASEAYETAFGNPKCLKMLIDWKTIQ